MYDNTTNSAQSGFKKQRPPAEVRRLLVKNILKPPALLRVADFKWSADKELSSQDQSFCDVR